MAEWDDIHLEAAAGGSGPVSARAGTVGSLFAGIGGFDLAFERAGYTVRWQVENDGAAQQVLRCRFPTTRLYDDVQTISGGTLEPVDVITAGFPCQNVSTAGKREGLAGSRTGLFWEIVRIVREMQEVTDGSFPRVVVLENVPGLLSSNGGRDFHTVLAALAELGFLVEWRILDSKFFRVAQRRRRVFIVLRARSAGDGTSQVLFESEGRDGDSPARNEAREDVAYCLAARAGGVGGGRQGLGNAWNTTYVAGQDVAATLRGRSHGPGVNMPGRGGEDDQNLVYGVHANQRGELRTSHLAGSLNTTRSGKQFEGVFQNPKDADLELFLFQDSQYGGRQYPEAGSLRAGRIPEHQMIFATLNRGGNDGGFRTEPGEHLVVAHALSASMGHHGHSSPRGDGSDNLIGVDLSHALTASNTRSGRMDPNGETYVSHRGVRRLTPLEAERLQAFPDGWTCLCGKGHLGSSFCECPDSQRYRQLGNAVTVSVVEWIATRLRQIM